MAHRDPGTFGNFRVLLPRHHFSGPRLTSHQDLSALDYFSLDLFCRGNVFVRELLHRETFSSWNF